MPRAARGSKPLATTDEAPPGLRAWLPRYLQCIGVRPGNLRGKGTGVRLPNRLVASSFPLLLAATLAYAQAPAPPAAPTLPPDAERIGEDRYRVGKVTVDLAAKTATCAGKINMPRGMIEYLAVAPLGKRHESVLLLDVRPLHLQVGLILLGLEPKGGLTFQGDPAQPKGSPVNVSVSWKRGGRTVRVPAEDLVWAIDHKRPMERGAWVFSGSAVEKGVLLADAERSLIATFHDPAAIVNNILPGGSDDTLYKVNERIAPPYGTPVTVTFAPGAAG